MSECVLRCNKEVSHDADQDRAPVVLQPLDPEERRHQRGHHRQDPRSAEQPQDPARGAQLDIHRRY